MNDAELLEAVWWRPARLLELAWVALAVILVPDHALELDGRTELERLAGVDVAGAHDPRWLLEAGVRR